MFKEIFWVLALALLQCLKQSQPLTPPVDIHAVIITSERFFKTNSCDENEVDGATNTTDRLTKLRLQLTAENISAYIILTSDEHQSEYVSDHDKRLKYISGFSGSAGTGVVTLKSAALWTDSRYFLQAEKELDCNWILMKSGVPGTPTISEWLSSQLSKGEAVSSDPSIAGYDSWIDWKNNLEKSNISMKLIEDNLVDKIWKEGRPPSSNEPIFVLDIKFAGMSWEQKLCLIREDMKKAQIDTMVITALDEIAWTLNLRGNDIPNFPVFRSYLIIEKAGATLFVSQKKVSPVVVKHLKANSTEGEHVKIKGYEQVWCELAKIVKQCSKIGLPSKFSYFQGVSYRLHHLVPANQLVLLTSPALVMKAHKNPTEVAGMRASHIRDGLVVCQFLCQLEEEVTAGSTNWTELKAVEVLNGLRTKQMHSKGISFGTIAAFGKNAANAHYQPTPKTNAVIDKSQVFMLDSGGHYLDGTTDTTRTVHFGTPKDIEKEIYTRLLIGCINVANVTFKDGYTLKQLEILIRAPLYELGLDYGHGSTHGIGSYLGVHESFNQTYHLNFFGSQEPGYYEENNFGMRLENIVTVVKAPTNRKGCSYLTFDTVTMIPYEKKMMKLEMLENRHIRWLNDYHAKVRELVGAEMKRQNMKKAYDWLVKKTEAIPLRK